MSAARPLAVITGASTGIGRELAKCCARSGFDLCIAADEPAIEDAAKELRAHGVRVQAIEVDLSTPDGVGQLHDALGGRPADILIANAGRGQGGAFLEQDFEKLARVVHTNITGTLHLIHRIGKEMRDRQSGRILIVGSIAGYIPGAYNAVYNSSKSFIDSFAWALRAELKETGVTVTCLMPGATDTLFFTRAGLEDTKLGQSKKDDPADVAERGFEALMKGEGSVVTGWQSKLRSAVANIVPAGILAGQHARQAKPGSGRS